MESEVLLTLHREFTEKEKLELCQIKVGKMRKQLQSLQDRNEQLKIKVEKLEETIRRDSLTFPSTMNGDTVVSVKKYLKLVRKYQEMDKRFWEVIQELNQLKQEEKL